jgi:hypothetical protein
MNNNLQNITQKTKDWASWNQLKTVVNFGRVGTSYTNDFVRNVDQGDVHLSFVSMFLCYEKKFLYFVIVHI